MCGIAGHVRSDGRVDGVSIERMCAAIEHRGPDSRGLHLAEGVGLGIQRLRVIDLATGDQPIYNEDRSVVVVLNGEIYNYRELRRALEASGHRFTTESDTEVIVHLYEDRGPDCVQALHGMFAFALWDARERRLLLARDRVGKKPLFYAETPDELIFGSELSAVMSSGRVSREIDHGALDLYLTYGYVPSPYTAFRSVRKLPPATVLVRDDDGTRLKTYWRLRYTPKRGPIDRDELHQEIRDGIRSAVRRRLTADVPVGAFLSGGVDSSAVVAAMAEISSKPVKTFSIGFEHEAFNELPLARRIARQFGTEHHEFIVRPDAMEILPLLVEHYGEPFADSSAIPSFYLAKLAREHVTVALNGDGGDESFAGYQRYFANLALAPVGRVPAAARRHVAGLLQRLPATGDTADTRNKLRRVAAALPLEPPARYATYMSDLVGLRRDDLYTDEYRAAVSPSRAPAIIEEPWRTTTANDLLDVMLSVDVDTYLPGDLLTKMDIATMAYSLEARSPLLDHEFMQLCAAIPASTKISGRRRKGLLRDALRGRIPDDILDGRKRGFNVPLADWFRNELRQHAVDVLLDPRTVGRGYFREDHVRGLITRHASGAEDHARGIWTLMMHELWHRRFVDEPRSAPH